MRGILFFGWVEMVTVSHNDNLTIYLFRICFFVSLNFTIKISIFDFNKLETMNKPLKIFLFLLLPLFSLHAQNKITDYLNVPGPIIIGSKVYNLTWSSHPNENYFKQEYLSSNENIEKYNTLVLVEFVRGNFDIKDVINQKVTELEEMKKANPLVNYQIYENNGEYILDFLVSENSKDGKEVTVAERNIYRYKLVTENNKGILLFAVSERGYKENMNAFFTNLKNNSTQWIEAVGTYPLPNIKIK